MSRPRLLGKTIQHVEQRRYRTSSGVVRQSIEAIAFTDGSTLRFQVLEGDDAEVEYGIELIYPARGIAEPSVASMQKGGGR